MLYTLQWSAAVTGFVAAVLWMRAATVKVAAGEPGTLRSRCPPLDQCRIFPGHPLICFPAVRPQVLALAECIKRHEHRFEQVALAAISLVRRFRSP
jgi:hypothetical protein